MAEKSKPCSKCNSTMIFRLGEYSCNECGHTEAAMPEPTQAGGPSGPGFKGGQQWASPPAQQTPRYGAAPPPPGTLYTPGTFSGGARIGSGSSEGNPISTTEYVIFGCLAFFFPLIGLIFGYIWSGQNRQGADGCLSAAWLWFGVNVVLIIISVFMAFSQGASPY